MVKLAGPQLALTTATAVWVLAAGSKPPCHQPQPAFLLFNLLWPISYGSGQASSRTSKPVRGTWDSPSTTGGRLVLSRRASPMDYGARGTSVTDKPEVMDNAWEVVVEGSGAPTTAAAFEVTPFQEGEPSRSEMVDRQQQSWESQGQPEEAVIPGAVKQEPSARRRPPGALALWELFRELDRHAVQYDVLDSREALESKLKAAAKAAPMEEQWPGMDGSLRQFQEQARGMSTKKLKEVLGKNGVAADLLGLEDRVALETKFVDMMYAYHHRGEHFLRERKPVQENQPPTSTMTKEASNDKTTSSVTSRSGGSVRGIFSSMEEAEVWASMLSLQELQVELDFLMVPYSRTRATRGQLARLLAQAIMNDEGYGVGIGEVSPVMRPSRKSSRKAKESRLPSSAASPSVRRARRLNDAISAYGGEEEFMDIDKAREELRSIFRSMSKEEQEANKERLSRRPSRPLFVDDEDEEESVGDGIGVMADRAWDAVQQVRTTAADLMAVAMDVEKPPRRPSYRARGLKPRSRGKQVASRSASRLGVVAMRSSLNSLIHGLVGAARWSGSGMLPARYVLFFVGVLCLVLRQGVGMFVTALFVIRALTGTLQGIIGSDEGQEEEEGGPNFLELVFS